MATFNDPLPCGPYVTPADLLACCNTATQAGYTETSPQVLDAIADASLLLYYATGRQFGTCTATVRPCLACGCMGEGGCCCEVSKIDLGLWPITAINSVHYDGAAQPLGDFHIDNFHELVRTNDQDPWPRCTNLWAATGGVHDNETEGYVFEIGITYGIAVPGLLERAARVLACELLNDACLGECKLPDRVTNISRRNLTMQVASAEDILRDNGGTGIYQVDLAVKTFNPSRLQSPSFVWNPQLSRNSVHRTYS